MRFVFWDNNLFLKYISNALIMDIKIYEIMEYKLIKIITQNLKYNDAFLIKLKTITDNIIYVSNALL